MNKQTEKKEALKALAGSLLGIIVFFIPFPDGSGQWQVPLVTIIGAVKGIVGGILPWVVLLVLAVLCAAWLRYMLKDMQPSLLFQQKSIPTGLLFCFALLVDAVLLSGIAPAWLSSSDVGGLVLKLSSTVFVTIIIAGFFVIFLTEFGFLEFLGTLFEPVMRPLYRLPGNAAVDAITSFVSAAAVGIFLTNKLYKKKIYTEREAAIVATSFSICSLGFFAVLASIAGIMSYLPEVIIGSFVINFILAAIMARLPPLSRKPDRYIDGSMAQGLGKIEFCEGEHIVARACRLATKRSALTGWGNIGKGLLDAVGFAMKIVAYVIAIATPALCIATYTPIFDWLGKIVEPYLALMQLPHPEAIAPTVLIGISEIALPAVLIAKANVGAMAAYFVCVLSTVQIIFFTESANAMLESSIPLKVRDLLWIFILRTVIAIPMVALATHIVF